MEQRQTLNTIISMKLIRDKDIAKIKQQAKIDVFSNISKQTPKQANTIDRIVSESLERVSKTIDEWRNNVESAEDIHNPDRIGLMEMYKDFVDDYQMHAVMQSRILKSISGTFFIMDEKGEKDEEESRKFIDPQGYPLQWVRDFMTAVVMAKFYGWGAIQLGNVIDNMFESVESIPYENLLPIFDSMMKNVNMLATPTGENTINFSDEEIDTWVVRTGDAKSLGLINKCAPYIIWKKVYGNWAQHASIFGMPLRVAKTDLADNERRQNLINAFEAATGASYIIQDLLDEVEVIEQKGGGDPHNIYGMLIEKCDQAISKVVLSQTGTTDEKAYSGSANVHSLTESDIISSDKIDIKSAFNSLLIPRMKKIGLISDSKKVWGGWDFAEKMSIKDWSDTILILNQAGYSIPAEEVAKKTGINIDETIIAVPDNKSFSIMNKINDLYGKDNS